MPKPTQRRERAWLGPVARPTGRGPGAAASRNGRRASTRRGGTAFLALRRYGAFGGLVGYTAARYGDAPAITDERGTLSFRELEDQSNALAHGLRANGFGAGTVIAALTRNHRGLMMAVSAANKIGARTVLLNTGFAGPQLADVCKREHVDVVLADDEFFTLLDALPAAVSRLLAWGQGPADVPTVEQLIAGPTHPVAAPAHPGGMVLLTTGTTGTPKGVSMPERPRRFLTRVTRAEQAFLAMDQATPDAYHARAQAARPAQ